MALLALKLFVAGVVEYICISLWYNAYTQHKALRIFVLTNIHLLLWLFVIGALITIATSSLIPWWIALSYIEGCALSSAMMSFFAGRNKI